MNVLVVGPEKVPCEAEIDGSLESMQKLVGGTIEAVYPFEDHVALVCNDEGKLNGLPLNRKLEDYDIIAGTFFICGLGEDDFTSLPPNLMDKYRDKFAKPELFMRMGSHIVAIPVEPQKEQKRTGRKIRILMMNGKGAESMFEITTANADDRSRQTNLTNG